MGGWRYTVESLLFVKYNVLGLSKFAGSYGLNFVDN